MQVDLSYGQRQFVVDVMTSDRKRLSITVHPDLRITAKAPAGYAMELPDPDNRETARALMLDWYSAHAKNLLARRLAQYLPTFVRMGASEPDVRYRRMQKRWGAVPVMASSC